MEGIAKARGVYTGRKSSIKREDVIRLLDEGVRPSVVARQLKISRTSVWRLSREKLADAPAVEERQAVAA